MSLGTIEVRRPRVRDLGERFVSKVLPLFKRQTKAGARIDSGALSARVGQWGF